MAVRRGAPKRNPSCSDLTLLQSSIQKLDKSTCLWQSYSSACMRLNVHCVTHDIEYSLQCSACDEEEAKSRRLVEIEYEIEAQRGHLRVLELERDALYQRQNTGEYDCPYCLYRRLKTGVSHCPSCQAEITQEQWRPIFDFERTLAKEWPKKEPESPYKPQYPPEVS